MMRTYDHFHDSTTKVASFLYCFCFVGIVVSNMISELYYTGYPFSLKVLSIHTLLEQKIEKTYPDVCMQSQT
jgi:hypothetical protein